jgi:transposase InsO family protein
VACRTLGIRHTRAKPRHAFTNGFVERIQQTILHEHWAHRVSPPLLHPARAARRLAPKLSRFYNHERAHHGYRTRGRTPASIVLAAYEG